MTEKRFKETISTGIVTDTITGKEYNCEMRIDDELLEFLNELAEENKGFKNELNLSKLKFHKMYMGLIEENKELKTFKDKVFEVIDNHVLEETDLRKEFIENGSHYSANISRNIIDTLKLIKKELEE